MFLFVKIDEMHKISGFTEHMQEGRLSEKGEKPKPSSVPKLQVSDAIASFGLLAVVLSA